MDFIQKILSLQNDELLVRIAIDKFDNINDRRKFVKKYDKVNFRKLKLKRNKIHKNYKKIITKLQK
jgi:hypothetical protein|tara:strand:+ start:517 stop:714 length:198 start_codon:yes stop_codon:yes gene_type:complete